MYLIRNIRIHCREAAYMVPESFHTTRRQVSDLRFFLSLSFVRALPRILWSPRRTPADFTVECAFWSFDWALASRFWPRFEASMRSFVKVEDGRRGFQLFWWVSTPRRGLLWFTHTFTRLMMYKTCVSRWRVWFLVSSGTSNSVKFLLD